MQMKLEQKLSQQLIMTPQLQQAIKLLQLSRAELEELINQSLIENPVLEEGTDIDSFPAENQEEENKTEELEVYTQAESVESAKETEKETSLPEDDFDLQDQAEFSSSYTETSFAGSDEELPSLEATLAQGKTLNDHLHWQLEMLNLNAIEHEIGEQIIGNVQDDGYLTMSIVELLELNPELYLEIVDYLEEFPNTLKALPEITEEKLQAKFEAEKPSQTTPLQNVSSPIFVLNRNAARLVESVLQRIQTFDPNGVGARTLQECLLIQLNFLNLKGELVEKIVQEDMHLLESKDLKKISRRQKEPIEKIIEAYKLIISLEPKPGRSFQVVSSNNYIIPDVYIFQSNGKLKVGLNENGVPRFRINGYYREMAESMQEDGNLTKEYIQEKIKSGQWLIKSIEQRQKTIYRVTQSILKFQKEFFEKGIHFLKPLVLKDVAQDIDVHESTVSRITTNKYVHTPQGIFELKYFFTSGIDQGQGEAISSKRIKEMIEQLVQSEESKNPYTDLQIAKILYQKSNIKVARRTVAKYREALHILPSNKRKQLF